MKPLPTSFTIYNTSKKAEFPDLQDRAEFPVQFTAHVLEFPRKLTTSEENCTGNSALSCRIGNPTFYSAMSYLFMITKGEIPGQSVKDCHITPRPFRIPDSIPDSISGFIPCPLPRRVVPNQALMFIFY